MYVVKRDQLPTANEFEGDDHGGRGALRQVNIHVSPRFVTEWLSGPGSR
jgi:hypothetical protein